MTNPCHDHAICENNDGSYICTCQDGFTGDGWNCRETNECLTNPCHDEAICENNEGSYLCTCKDGFTGDGWNCRDSNECLTSPCHHQVTCKNNEGSYDCICQEGVTGDGWTCRDTNECLTNPCHDQAICNNNEGSYDCICETGFIGDGWNCVDATKGSCNLKIKVTKAPQKFMTPNHPGMYDRNIRCHWTLVSANGGSIALKFDKFIIYQWPYETGRCYDYVRVSTSKNILAEMCGFSTPSQIFRSQGEMTVTLFSSQYGWTSKKRGFLATVVEGKSIS